MSGHLGQVLLYAHELRINLLISMPNSVVTVSHIRPPEKMRIGNLFSLFLIQNIFCGCSKEPSQLDGSFQHLKHMFKLTCKKILFYAHKIPLSGSMSHAQIPNHTF